MADAKLISLSNLETFKGEMDTVLTGKADAADLETIQSALDAKAPIASPAFTTSISMGRMAGTASAGYSVATGYNVTATGTASHAEGLGASASGDYSHAEGWLTNASGISSHTEGHGAIAYGDASHAEGNYTTASGDYSHAEGYYTIATSENQHVQGKYNIEDNTNVYAHIVGNGSGDTSRSNAHTLDWDGNAWFAGEVEDGHGNKLSEAGTPVVTTDDTSTGAAYTATVPGITELTTGASFIMVTHAVSTSTTCTLDVNGLGAKTIKRRISTLGSQTASGYSASWLTASKAYHLVYDGTYWIVENMTQPAAADLYGTVTVAKGGTGYTSITDTTYTTARYRASALYSTETAPTSNGVINWTYE